MNLKRIAILEYLDSNDNPYRTWAYPDNVNGLNQFLNTLRAVDRRGLYDYRISSKVHTLAASGVGGGSLVYTNVTEKPLASVLDLWDTQLNLGINDSVTFSKVYRSKLKEIRLMVSQRSDFYNALRLPQWQP